MVREARTSTHGYQVKDNDYHAGLEYPSCTKSSLGSWKVFEEAMPCCRIIPRLHGEGNGNPLQCSCLENCRDGGAWWAAIYGVAQSRTRLKWLNSSSSSRSGLQGLSRWLSCKESVCQAGDIGENPDPWVRKIPWRRKWQPTPVFLPGKSHGQRSLEGFSPWGRKRIGYNLATKQQQWFTDLSSVPHSGPKIENAFNKSEPQFSHP